MDSDSQLDWSLFLEDNPAAKDLLKDTTCTTDGSSTTDDNDNDDEDAAYYSSLFQLYDGNWAVNGHWLTERMGSMLECLQSSSYFDLDGDHDDNYHESNSSLNESSSEFFYLEDYLPLDNHHKYDELQQLLQCRNLAMASLMIRCLAADLIAPPYVPIRRLSPSQRRTVAELKRQANEAFFFQNDHATALQLYDQALQQFKPSLICGVMPVQDLKELVTLLASQADCYFQLQDFANVGYLASYALVFDATHTKARILRAKAELALAQIAVMEEQQAAINDNDNNHHESLRYTLQAKMDLEQVLSSFGKNKTVSTSRAEETVARELVEDVVQPMLQRERERVVEGNGGIVEWNSHVKNITATCWQTHNLFLTTTSTTTR